MIRTKFILQKEKYHKIIYKWAEHEVISLVSGKQAELFKLKTRDK